MDIKDYINSGVVEMYSLGNLNEPERTEFEQKLLLYPELGKELNKVQEALSGYANAYEINPRPSLRSEILESTLNGKAVDKKILPNSTLAKNHSLTYKYLIAASLAALAISTFASWFFYSRWEDSEERYSQLLREKNQLAQNYNLVKDGFDKTVYDMLVIRDPQAKVINLHSIDSTQNFIARIYENVVSKEIYIDVIALDEPMQDHEYQLWGLVDGVALSAGLFDAHEFSGIQRMQEIENAKSWFVTLEPKGGSTTPTLERQVLVSDQQ
ncbi:MAG TPA: anti-sigma factor [Bacteroidia bacterium]|nr:anti-sigma factor [Bacteroidia bacterium]HNS12811.1 anti-sigma factor [Bacteroidia bacterium]